MTQEEKNNYHLQVNQDIEKYGYHITFVFASDNPSFCYSTGIYKTFAIPEIFISSLPQNLSFELVKNYVNAFSKLDTVPVDTKIESLSDRFPVYLIRVENDKINNYALSSVHYYKDHHFKYVQLVYPDTKGNFPDDHGYDYDQEILGKFTS